MKSGLALHEQNAVSELARAKVNLTLHVTGRRANGYHELDSLVVFAADPEAADRITVREADDLALVVRGPRGRDLPSDSDNLVLRAARLMQSPGLGAEIVLDKVLPVASGIGGGSADAAATLRALSRLWGEAMPSTAEVMALGADLPVCRDSRAARMSGLGEVVTAAPNLPPLPAVLVNPGVPVATPSVFAALDRRDNARMPEVLPSFAAVGEAAAWLATQRNDLEAAARGLVPQIAEVLAALRSGDDCLLARMSGSGATCFGLYADRSSANAAAARITARAPQWWVAATVLA